MRFAAVLFALAALPALASIPVIGPLSAFSSGCGGSTPASSDDTDGSSLPADDGAVCACATPDCLPNCSDLPACKLECTSGSDTGPEPTSDGGTTSGATLLWVDSCGHIQYAQACANGCSDASPATCQ